MQTAMLTLFVAYLTLAKVKMKVKVTHHIIRYLPTHTTVKGYAHRLTTMLMRTMPTIPMVSTILVSSKKKNTPKT